MSASIDEASGHQRNQPTAGPDSTEMQRTRRPQEEMSEEISTVRKTAFDRVGEAFRTPVGGAAVAGTIVLGAATVFGVPEALLGATAAYGVYLINKKRRASR